MLLGLGGKSNMKKVVVGKKDGRKKYDFRETCFGIVYKNNLFYLTSKKGEPSLIGGGIEEGENPRTCLEREFMEEAGLTVTDIHEFVTVDCYWFTRSKVNMNSLANFYIVEVSDEEVEPTEAGHELVKVTKEEILDLLPLPYHKKALEMYLEDLK